MSMNEYNGNRDLEHCTQAAARLGSGGADFLAAIDALRAATPEEFTRALRYARLVSQGRGKGIDVEVALHPFVPLSDDLNGDRDRGDIPNLVHHYGYGIDVEQALKGYVQRMTSHFGDRSRRSVTTILQNHFQQDGEYCPDIVNAAELHRDLRDVHSAGMPEWKYDETGHLDSASLHSFFVGMRHDDPMVLRGVHESDVYWLHGHAYDVQLRQCAEQLFAALHFGVYLPGTDEERLRVNHPERGVQDCVMAVRRCIEELQLVRETGFIRYGIVWDQLNRRKTGASSLSHQLTVPATAIYPTLPLPTT